MPVNMGNQTDRTQNCAMCSIAGILGLNTFNVETLVGAQGQCDEALANAFGIGSLEGEELFKKATEKIWRLIYIELQKQTTSKASRMLNRGRKWISYRSGINYSDLKDATQLFTWMRQFSSGTKFAIWGSHEFPGHNAHWNCARKEGDNIEFIDYQYNMNNIDPLKTANHFIKPIGSNEDDSEWEKFVAFAFTQTPLRHNNVL